MSNVSSSFIVREFLKQQQKGYTFTPQELYKTLLPLEPGVTIGGIGGFCSRARRTGNLEAVAEGQGYRYILVDMEGVNVRRSSSPGSSAGRKNGLREPRLHAVTVASVQERLLELATELEKARTPLADYSTDDLLSELVRRQKAANKEA